MKPEQFSDASPGLVVEIAGGEGLRRSLCAFVPDQLPARGKWVGELVDVLSEATLAVGELKGLLGSGDEVGAHLLVGPLEQREAVLSSRIEGTTANVDELAMFSVDEVRVEREVPDVREVANYSAALSGAVEALSRRPKLSLGLIREIHRRLMEGARGEGMQPGEFRDCQVYIGSSVAREAKFVPPPPLHVRELMENLEAFLNDPGDYPPLVAMAMCHYQFETIHPFRDGNGRVGRLLIALQGMLLLKTSVPAVQMSAFFEGDRRSYYDGLMDMSVGGNWEAWVRYFLTGVVETVGDSIRRVTQLREIHRRYRREFQTGSSSGLTLRLIDWLFLHPAVSVGSVAEELAVSFPTAQRHIDRLCRAGLLREVSDRQRGRLYLAEEIVAVVREA